MNTFWRSKVKGQGQCGLMFIRLSLVNVISQDHLEGQLIQMSTWSHGWKLAEEASARYAVAQWFVEIKRTGRYGQYNVKEEQFVSLLTLKTRCCAEPAMLPLLHHRALS